MLIRTWSVDRSIGILDLTGRLSADTGALMCNHVAALVANGRCHIVMNLVGVSAADAGGLGQLAGAVRMIRNADRRLSVVARPGEVLELLSRTQLRRFFPVFNTEAEAIAAAEALC